MYLIPVLNSVRWPNRAPEVLPYKRQLNCLKLKPEGVEVKVNSHRKRLCKTCGETDPAKFAKGHASKCRQCYNLEQRERDRKKRDKQRTETGKQKRQSFHHCRTCGETDPKNFYGLEKSACKTCRRTRKNAEQEEMRRKAREKKH